MMRTDHLIRAGHPVLALLFFACTNAPPASSHAIARAASAPPIGLYGTWVANQSQPSGHDTLFLLPNSVARGRISEPEQPAVTVTRWQIKYLSKDARDTRRDRLGRQYQDGGDLSCTVAPDSTCVSAPVLCIGDGTRLDCMGFALHGDSLALSNGAKYRRAARS